MARKQTDQEIMGVLHGEKFAREQLGLKPIQLDHHKGRSQGFDSVWKDPQTGNYVIIDFKGGPSSKLKGYQKEAAYIGKVADKTVSPNSKAATLREKRAARLINRSLEKGKTVEFLAVKTPKSGKTFVSDRSSIIKAANQSDSFHRYQPRSNNNQAINRIGNAKIRQWQENPPRQLSRKPANDNAQTQKPNPPKQTPPPQQSPKRSR